MFVCLFVCVRSSAKRMETEYDYLFKIVLIGDAGVGKTSIVRRYTDGIFTSAGIPTIGVDFCIKTLHIGSSAVKVGLPVKQQVPLICSLYYHDSHYF